MLSNDVIEAVNTWTVWANCPDNGRYDIALLKIWIQFEKFISELFEQYALGEESESGFSPTLKLRFTDEEQLNAFLRDTNRQYVDYPAKIEKLSKFIFENNPFDVIFLDSVNSTAYKKMTAVRNYIAHESGDAKRKMINTCFSGNEDYFCEPNIYLLQIERSTSKTNYSYFIDIIKNMTTLLVSPPTN